MRLKTVRFMPTDCSHSPASRISISPRCSCLRRILRCRPRPSTTSWPRPSTTPNSLIPASPSAAKHRNQLGLYLGPKEVNTLRKVNPKLEDIIDWGLFGIIAKPLFLILQWMTTHLVA